MKIQWVKSWLFYVSTKSLKKREKNNPPWACLCRIEESRHVKFLKKKCGTTRGKSVIFLKNPWETLKCLLQTLQYACYLPRSLAITQSNVLVYSALKFDPLLYRSHFFCWANPWRWFAFRHLCWVYQVIQPLGLFVPVLFGFTFKPLIDIDFSMTLRRFTRQQFETTKLPYDINIDHCRKQEARYRLVSRECNIDFGDFRQIITRNGF